MEELEMKKFNKVIAIGLASLTIAGLSSPVFASEDANLKTISSEKTAEPYLNIQNQVYNLTTGWSTIATDNNWMDATIKVTNHAGSDGWIMLRVLDKNGAEVDATDGGISPGGWGTVSVPFNKGTYKLEAKAQKSGKYILTIKD